MGERGSIVIMPRGAKPLLDELIKNPDSIILYTHWGGAGMPSTLQDSIKHLGIGRAKDRKTLAVDLLNRDFVVTDYFEEYAYPTLMVSPDRAMIYFDVNPNDYQWGEWSYQEFVNLSPKNMALLEDASQKEQMERWRDDAESRQRQTKYEKNTYLSSLTISSIPIALAGAMGLASYFKSRNQQQ